MELNYNVLKILLITIVIKLVIAIIGCSDYKATFDLNIYHPYVVKVFENILETIGVFCTSQNYYNDFNINNPLAPHFFYNNRTLCKLKNETISI